MKRDDVGPSVIGKGKLASQIGPGSGVIERRVKVPFEKDVFDVSFAHVVVHSFGDSMEGVLKGRPIRHYRSDSAVGPKRYVRPVFDAR